uniref:HORMA domain-containing protein n=1 Tax=Heterorhabditis bacteriophora TaxID=37862 RepID=A0A1I7WD21_HETBA
MSSRRMKTQRNFNVLLSKQYNISSLHALFEEIFADMSIETTNLSLEQEYQPPFYWEFETMDIKLEVFYLFIDGICSAVKSCLLQSGYDIFSLVGPEAALADLGDSTGDSVHTTHCVCISPW